VESGSITFILQNICKLNALSVYFPEKVNKETISLLEDTVVPINEIAFELGLKAIIFYKHLKKKITNDTPENYRRNNNKSKN
jgi:hypothetical protein